MPVAEQEPPVGEQGEAVPVPVAARRLGKSPDTIRSAIRRGKLSATKGNDGQWRVWLPADPDIGIDSHQQELDRLRAELAASMRREVDSAATGAELRERLARAEGEGTAAAQIILELRAALQWHRQPWWRRLVGGS